MAAFDAYLMVDWSAASAPAPANPAQARDSIWWALAVRQDGIVEITDHRHARTRAGAVSALGDLLTEALMHGRVLACFDFAFGYPDGTAEALNLGTAGLVWRKLWKKVSAGFTDDTRNRNNRFDLAAGLNREFGSVDGPFWGYPHQHHGRYDGLPFRKPQGYGSALPKEWRLADHHAKGTHSVWQLSGNGIVGGQTLTGIPALWALRTDPRLAEVSAIWPFETGLCDDERARIVIAETWPSLFPVQAIEGLPKDAAQVSAVVHHLADLDDRDLLDDAMRGGVPLTPKERLIVETEEGWILGLGHA